MAGKISYKVNSLPTVTSPSRQFTMYVVPTIKQVATCNLCIKHIVCYQLLTFSSTTFSLIQAQIRTSQCYDIATSINVTNQRILTNFPRTYIKIERGKFATRWSEKLYRFSGQHNAQGSTKIDFKARIPILRSNTTRKCYEKIYFSLKVEI